MPDPSKPPAEDDFVNDQEGVHLNSKDKTKLLIAGVVIVVVIVLALIGIGL